MKKLLSATLLFAAACGGTINSPAATDQAEPPILGMTMAKDAPVADGKPGGGGNLLFHNGEIMTTAAVTAIFWGTSWGSYTGDKITGMDSYYQGYNGSHYANTSNEYTGTNGQVTSSTPYNGHKVDTSAAGSPKSSSTILAEVCKVIGTSAVHNGYYPVYSDQPRGSAGYCGYHSAGTCNGVTVQFAFFFNLDGDSGCDPGDTYTTHSQGLAAIANTSSHELSEARTDPNNGGWYDSSGNENGDKCNFNFKSNYVTFSNGTIWRAQSEWSNAAGGCIDYK